MGSIAPMLDWQALGNAAAVACALTLALCLVLVATRGWHGPVTNDDATGIQKFHKSPTPRVGGLAVALAYFLAVPALPDGLRPAWVLIGLAGLPALGAGLAEDLTRRVGVRWRLGATMISGVLFALMTGYVMDKVDLPGVDWLLSFGLVGLAFTGFAIGGVANAINIIDGFNGLAAGALLIMLAAFAYVGHAVGDGLVVALAVIYAGLVLGFFAINFPHGRIFLGDGGAYFCGYLLATLGVLLPARNAEISAWCAVLICAYPVIETLASMRRKSRREGHSVGRPDRVHFHMLAHRRYARRLVKAGGPLHLRNPVTSVVTWAMPTLTAVLAAIAYDNTLLCAVFFFVTVFVYGLLYRVMSLNGPTLPLGLARLL
jgi:UDP-N-acetylmuramyl pentapeptide phosphotransferase/UDP-N-acetylglucosamine-1-phosphate transferase